VQCSVWFAASLASLFIGEADVQSMARICVHVDVGLQTLSDGSSETMVTSNSWDSNRNEI